MWFCVTRCAVGGVVVSWLRSGCSLVGRLEGHYSKDKMRKSFLLEGGLVCDFYNNNSGYIHQFFLVPLREITKNTEFRERDFKFAD